ncbi:MAG: serine/threonine protein kinase [Planctomycetaceae bacterium]|nr:serine/threonine protein kinase [Planctomycetaceae bacterium]
MKSLKSFFHQSGKKEHSRPAHMTWAKSTVGRSVTRATLFLKQQLWIWPIIAVLLLSAIGFGTRTAIERTMKANLESGLKTILELETEMLLTLFKVQESTAETQARDLETRNYVYDLLAHTDGIVEAEALDDVELIRRKLSKSLAPVMSTHNYSGYFVADKKHEILASSEASLVGRKEVEAYESFLNTVFDDQTTVSPPFPSLVPLKTESGERRTGEPVMYVSAPIRDENFQVVAALAFQIRPEREFTRLLQLGRVGQSGETYAFNSEGLMISNSRFDHDLILLGLLPDEPGTRSLLKLQVRDPGGDMTAGYRPGRRRSEMPLTLMAASAIDGNSSSNVEGYNDYRGVPVIGAWNWLDDYDMGITTEVDVAQAYRPLVILQRTFMGLYVLLGISAIAIFVFTVIVAHLRQEARQAAVEAKQLGQYTLEEKIGAGAMGEVYRAYHSMLRRPTAVKMLNLDLVNEASIARFEREVQITCKLNNPHTVAIYDFGRTPEGVFYYAMEYLDGIDLQTLVERYGPQPEARVIHILKQMCSSLYEAHSQGLVHRDIKPANTMLNDRGGEPDTVKVLDFGLVKALDDEKQAKLSSAGTLTGTPLYMSPESIQTPHAIDARSDLYAVGAVGYFLLTGKPVFDAQSIVELCNMHVTVEPEPPSGKTSQPISEELENALLSCLEKSLAKRPQTARDLAILLDRSPFATEWSLNEAASWWRRHNREIHAESHRPLSEMGATQTDDSPAPSASENDEDGDSFDQTVIG